MTPKELVARMRMLAISEMKADEASWYYLSFADENKFLGATFLRAWGPVTAVELARILGLNPGGSVHIEWTMDEEMMRHVPETHRYRLLTRSELEAIGPVMSVEELEAKRQKGSS